MTKRTVVLTFRGHQNTHLVSLRLHGYLVDENLLGTTVVDGGTLAVPLIGGRYELSPQ
jgi:hypothetical protein